jgi:hypothetical protein
MGGTKEKDRLRRSRDVDNRRILVAVRSPQDLLRWSDGERSPKILYSTSLTMIPVSERSQLVPRLKFKFSQQVRPMLLTQKRCLNELVGERRSREVIPIDRTYLRVNGRRI